MPLLLQVDPGLDLDVLREKFSFELISEHDDGYVILAAEDVDLAAFALMVGEFAVQVRGSAKIAQVHRLFDDPEQQERLQRVLSPSLIERWPAIGDNETVTVDVGIACTGTEDVPPRPKRGKRDRDALWAKKEHEWAAARERAYVLWDELKQTRERDLEQFASFYNATLLQLVDGGAAVVFLPDSFTARIRISGRGLRDLVLNHPYVFEVTEPEQIDLGTRPSGVGEPSPIGDPPLEPLPDAPAICIVDSGIQEQHPLLAPAIDAAASRCFVFGKEQTDVGDFVAPGGHGTRVAGAVLYGEAVLVHDEPLAFWIQNARVLNEENKMPEEMLPAEVIRSVVDAFHHGPRKTRIFNHSINASVACRTRHMSSWAAEIDALSNDLDILIVQAVGNFLPVRARLLAGKRYPEYLYDPEARVANPGQSVQALTVGSVGYGAFSSGPWSTFCPDRGHVSSFSRLGPSIWATIKPEVVEYGGDSVRTTATPPDVQDGIVADACPELVRATFLGAGPIVDRDAVGTSFAAPKVSRIAGLLQTLLPGEPALLYRALIVQSARWPDWAEAKLDQLREPGAGVTELQKESLRQEANRTIRAIGYGIPDTDRATTNSDHRTTLISNGESLLRGGECHIYQVPIPLSLRGQADEFRIRVDVTLSYSAQPRRTRRRLNRYLSTWLDWKSNKLGEDLEAFKRRAIKEGAEDTAEEDRDGEEPFPWTLHEQATYGVIRDVRRNGGTVQKDWAVIKSNALPEQFCIAVAGHRGWSADPDSSARYSLAVSFEILGREIPIYEPIRTAVEELITVVEAESQSEVEVEVQD